MNGRETSTILSPLRADPAGREARLWPALGFSTEALFVPGVPHCSAAASDLYTSFLLLIINLF